MAACMGPSENVSPRRACWDPKYHRWLLAAFSKRVIADYGIEAELTAADAQEMIAQAREFCNAGGRLLEPPAEPGKPP
jgi:uncharacterized protein (UPF0332 family)